MARPRKAENFQGTIRRLKRSGERVRYNGFWLNDTARDRAIADWITETPSVGSIIKDLIYRHISGVREDAPVYRTSGNVDSDGKATEAFMDFED